MRVFLDTDVLVSGFATRGLCADVVRLVLAEHELVTAEVVQEELTKVLRQKFGLPDKTVRLIRSLLMRHTVQPKPRTLPAFRLRDKNDLSVLDAALAAKADILITGDRDFLDIRDEVSGITITGPRGFWDMITA